MDGYIVYFPFLLSCKKVTLPQHTIGNINYNLVKRSSLSVENNSIQIYRQVITHRSQMVFEIFMKLSTYVQCIIIATIWYSEGI